MVWFFVSLGLCAVALVYALAVRGDSRDAERRLHKAIEEIEVCLDLSLGTITIGRQSTPWFRLRGLLGVIEDREIERRRWGSQREAMEGTIAGLRASLARARQGVGEPPFESFSDTVRRAYEVAVAEDALQARMLGDAAARPDPMLERINELLQSMGASSVRARVGGVSRGPQGLRSPSPEVAPTASRYDREEPV